METGLASFYLGKALESVVAERISHAAEAFGLLSTNHFGARKKHSAEQALLLLLLLLRERTYSGLRSEVLIRDVGERLDFDFSRGQDAGPVFQP